MKYDVGVFIGRFQPFHNGHLACIKAALAVCEYLIIIIGSAGQPRRWDILPFDDDERALMIAEAVFAEQWESRVKIELLPDSDYSNEDWIASVQTLVTQAIIQIDIRNPKKLVTSVGHASVALVGHSKDQSSYYIKMFPEWDTVEVENHEGLDGTAIREAYFESRGEKQALINAVIENMLPFRTAEFLHQFAGTPEFNEMLAERDFMLRYQSGWDGAPYPPTFVTADPVVIQAAHVLLVQRKDRPGKGLWALPGGHVERGDTIFETALKELTEETRLKVPEAILRRSVRHQEVFDHPLRSSRKRTITHAFLFHLVPEIAPRRSDETAAQFAHRVRTMAALPKVKAGSDAKRAVWVPLADLDRSTMFEDHYKIIKRFERHLGRGE